MSRRKVRDLEDNQRQLEEVVSFGVNDEKTSRSGTSQSLKRHNSNSEDRIFQSSGNKRHPPSASILSQSLRPKSLSSDVRRCPQKVTTWRKKKGAPPTQTHKTLSFTVNTSSSLPQSSSASYLPVCTTHKASPRASERNGKDDFVPLQGGKKRMTSPEVVNLDDDDTDDNLICEEESNKSPENLEAAVSTSGKSAIKDVGISNQASSFDRMPSVDLMDCSEYGSRTELTEDLNARSVIQAGEDDVESGGSGSDWSMELDATENTATVLSERNYSAIVTGGKSLSCRRRNGQDSRTGEESVEGEPEVVEVGSNTPGSDMTVTPNSSGRSGPRNGSPPMTDCLEVVHSNSVMITSFSGVLSVTPHVRNSASTDEYTMNNVKTSHLELSRSPIAVADTPPANNVLSPAERWEPHPSPLVCAAERRKSDVAQEQNLYSMEQKSCDSADSDDINLLSTYSILTPCETDANQSLFGPKNDVTSSFRSRKYRSRDSLQSNLCDHCSKAECENHSCTNSVPSVHHDNVSAGGRVPSCIIGCDDSNDICGEEAVIEPDVPRPLKNDMLESELARQVERRKQASRHPSLSPLQESLGKPPKSNFYTASMNTSVRTLSGVDSVKKAVKACRKGGDILAGLPKGINPFSKPARGQSGKWKSTRYGKVPCGLKTKKALQIEPRLSTKQEFNIDCLRLQVGTVHMGALKMLARKVIVDNEGIQVSLLADNDDTHHQLNLEWKHMTKYLFHMETKPAILAFQPTQYATTAILNRLHIKRTAKPPVLHAESLDKARTFILLELQDLPHTVIVRGVTEKIRSRIEKDKIEELTFKGAEDLLDMMTNFVESPPVNTRPTRSRPCWHDSTETYFSSDDDDKELPEVPLNTNQMTQGESTIDMATTGPTQCRRSTRRATYNREPLPEIDFTFRPKFGGQSLRVTTEDLSTLQEGEFLNDTVINLYLQYLLDGLSDVCRERVHIFSSFFFTRMSNTKADGDTCARKTMFNQERLHARVRNWTKSVDIFAKDYLIVPVCHLSHWLVFIVYKPGLYSKERRAREIEAEKRPKTKTKSKSEAGVLDLDSSQSDLENLESDAKVDTCVEHVEPLESCLWTLDSLGSSRPHLARRISHYLNEEWRSKKDSNDSDHFLSIRVDRPKIPLQPNSSDCGVYLLHFVEELFKKISVGDEVMENGVFCDHPPLRKRKKLMELLQRLDREANTSCVGEQDAPATP